MIKNENFINIQGWMVNELHLKGNELIIFALIYGFSQDENSVFSGSLSYMADWINASRQCVISILQKLVEKNFIIKIEKTVNNVKLADYKINLTVVKNFDYPSQENLLDSSQKNLPHNNINNNNNINNIYIAEMQKPEKSKRENLQAYGEFQNVMLTKDEIRTLINKYGFYFQDAIELLSAYIVNKQGKKYVNHYAVMKENGWVWEKVHNNPNCGIRKKVQLVQDANAKGGYREETMQEYYKRTMNIEI